MTSGSRRAASVAAAMTAALAFGAAGRCDAAQPRRFDESSAFDRVYASHFLTDVGNRKLFLLGAFAQFFLPQGSTDTSASFRQADGDPPTASKPAAVGGSPAKGKAVAPAAADFASPTVADEVCGCRFNGRGEIVDPTHCRALRNNDDEEAARMDLLPLIDIASLARPLACFRDGSPYCVDEGGLRYGGVACCQRIDKGLRGAVVDSHFFMLAPFPLVQRLKGLVPGAVAANSPELCGFRIDAEQGAYAPPQRFDGTYARAALHAFFRYGLKPNVTPDILVSVSERSPATLYEVVRERIVRARLRAPEKMLDNALRAVPVSPGFRYNGAVE